MTVTSLIATTSEKLRTSLWFVPSMMTFSAAALAVLLVRVDMRYGAEITDHFGWIYSGAAQGARSVLSSIAGSMITAASVTFSLTAVAVSLAAQQFGSRVLRNFLRDRVTQVVLGTFVSTFVYCLLVERTVRGSDAVNIFVPHLSITVGVLFAVVSLMLLIYFVHHVTSTIQAANIVQAVGSELKESIDRIFPDPIGAGGAHENLIRGTEAKWAGAPILIVGFGYLQGLAADLLLQSAKRRNAVIELCIRPGDYVINGQTGAMITPESAFDPDLQKEFEEACILGVSRTPTQDVRYSFDQLTEVAVRALSPGINDPFTAINCIDRLTQELSRVATRKYPSRFRFDENGELRVIANGVAFPELLDSAFGHIALYAQTDTFVQQRLSQSLAQLENYARRADDLAAIRKRAHILTST